MKDIQSLHDSRRINIKKVGVKDISYPIMVLDKAKRVQHTVANVNMYVNLPHHFKGTHMSRFIEILNKFHGEIHVKRFQEILAAMKDRLKAEAAHLEIAFSYFLHQNDRQAPGREYRCRMHGSLNKGDLLTIEVRVPIAPPSFPQQENIMPRSLGHWGHADISLRFEKFIWIEDVITLVEKTTSHDLHWPGGAETGLSVEQMTKALGKNFTDHPDITWFTITVENYSKGYNTFATLEWPGKTTT